jgi:excinuclease ABC subunit B
MEGAYVAPEFRSAKVAEPASDYRSLTPEQALRRIKKLEQEMLKHARNLEFEEAARLRDEIQKLRNVELGLPPGLKAG